MIFEDPSGHRWKISVLVFALMVTMIVLFVTAFVGSIFVSPYLPNVQQSSGADSPTPVEHPDPLPPTSVTDADPAPHPERLTLPSSSFVSSTVDIWRLTRKHPILTMTNVTQRDPESIAATTAHLETVDIVAPDWYTVTRPACDIDEHIDPTFTAAARHASTSLVPRIQVRDAWTDYTTNITFILEHPSLRSCFARLLAERARTQSIHGFQLDIQTLPSESEKAYASFITDLASLLHAQHHILLVTLPSRAITPAIRDIAEASDGIVVPPLMHVDRSSPAILIPTQEERTRDLETLTSLLPAHKLIVGLDAFGFDWKRTPQTDVRTLPAADLLATAYEVGAKPRLTLPSGLMEYDFTDEEKHEHHVWFTNAVTTWNTWMTARQHPIIGFSITRPEWEDPAVWSFVPNPNATADSLVKAPSPSDIAFLNRSEIYHIGSAPHDGELTLRLDPNGIVTSAIYTTVPTGYVLDRIGSPIQPKTLVLAFEDGPDPVWTPKVIERLTQYHVPAVFFVIGREAKKYPAVLKQLADHHFIIGNHTYTNTDFESMSTQRLELELNATQRLISSAYGQKTILFRAPNYFDIIPHSAKALELFKHANALGYITVSSYIDSRDWSNDPPEALVTSIEQQLETTNGHILLFHDAGRDRSKTLAILDQLIPTLRAKGYVFSDISEAINLPRTTLNPPVAVEESFLDSLPHLWIAIQRYSWFGIVWLFRISLAISALRLIGLGILVIRSARNASLRKQLTHPEDVFVSIIIPAYNEEKTIEKTVRTVQQSSHTRYEVLVVDDGSTDRTTDVVRALSKEDKRIHLLTKPNGGKSSALNLGFQQARSEIVVTIDADTILYPETITELLKPFGDRDVDAVCGNVEVGNVRNLLTGFQSLEYITTQNFDRRAFDELNCISVVPGATGAWKRERVLALGGYSGDTLTEDADITLRLLRSGGKIVYASAARSKTEAPETVTALAKQRFRWSFGTFQCMSKHMDAFFHGTLGWVALPNMLLFQIIFPVLSPLGDFVFLFTILRGDIRPILAGYLLFLVMDLCGSLLAFTLEKQPRKLMWLILIQRFFYRQFMYVLTFRSILAVLRGHRHGWNKLKRMGTVQTAVPATSPTSSGVLQKEP